jgi:hypothetical protein
LVKSGKKRSQKFTIKFDPDVMGMRSKLYKSHMVKGFSNHSDLEVQVEQIINQAFADLGLDPMNRWNLYVKCKHYAQAYKNDETWRLPVLKSDFVSEGYPETILITIEAVVNQWGTPNFTDDFETLFNFGGTLDFTDDFEMFFVFGGSLDFADDFETY